MRPILIFLLTALNTFNLLASISYPKTKPNLLTTCEPSTSQIELNINNVRARLLGGGDMWWDGKSMLGSYLVPNFNNNSFKTSIFYSSSLWYGGLDVSGNIKIAAGTFRNSGIDFWSGPLDENGNTNSSNCNNWDRHFVVYSKEIIQHKNAFKLSKQNGTIYFLDSIPENIRYWPSKGNPFFITKYNFDLPSSNQGLAPFFDENGDDIYNPVDGDYPILDSKSSAIADQMVFWITNDGGNIHTNTNSSEPIGIEIQNMAFAFLTDDYVINNTTFYNQRVINRKSLLNKTYLSLWTDPDLGCSKDDMLGYDTLRNLMFVYNGDSLDGYSNCDCDSKPTFCDKLPMFGIDILSHSDILIENDSINQTFDTLTREKISSFTYYSQFSEPSTIWGDPFTSLDYYNYNSGHWKNGSNYVKSILAYNFNTNSDKVKYVFTGEPCDSTQWSMYDHKIKFTGNDIRSIQTLGPFSTYSGQIIDLSYAVVYTPNVIHPKPCLNAIRDADDRIQNFFDSLFYLNCYPDLGPDAPELITLPKNQSITFGFINNENSNNENLDHSALCNVAPIEAQDKNYRFEGYRVYQLKDNKLDNNRLEVFQCDLKNNIKDIYSFTPNLDANGQPSSWNKLPYIQKSNNNGIPQSFTLSYDAFTGKRLQNGKTYYYTVVAYDYNNYEEFNTVENYGQRKQYLEGSRNLKIYAVTPQSNDKYLIEPIVTRLEGVGTGNNILQISAQTRDSIFKNINKGRVTYTLSSSPINLLILDPSKCNGKQFQLSIVDTSLNDTILAPSTKWRLQDLTNNSIVSSRNSIFDFNETLIDSFGIMLRVEQALEPGDYALINTNNGFRGVKISYNNLPFNWYEAIGDGFVNTNNGKINSPSLKFFNPDLDLQLDPNFAFIESNNLFYPFGIMDYRSKVVQDTFVPYFTSGWMNENTFGAVSRGYLANLNNVDIVLTPDKSKWSRCVIIESANSFYTNKKTTDPQTTHYLGLNTKPNPSGIFPTQFDLRGDLSVGKYDSDGDGKPDPDGALDSDGSALYGMGWFPGYAVNIETGKRLNIFFGENSCYSQKYDSICKKENQIGGDMLWNPNGNLFIGDTLPKGSAYNYFAGGQHFIYITDQVYDSCNTIRKGLKSNNKSLKAYQFRSVTWSSMPLIAKSLKPLGAGNKGLIPSECLIKLRVNNAFQWKKENGINNGYPTYLIDFKTNISIENKLSESNVVSASNVLIHPNPFSFSKHSTLAMSNLPENCKVDFYNLAGNLLFSQSASSFMNLDAKSLNFNSLYSSVLLIKITNISDNSFEIKKVIIEKM